MKTLSNVLFLIIICIIIGCSDNPINSPNNSADKLLKIPVPDDVDGNIVDFKIVTQGSEKKQMDLISALHLRISI